jgi:hypothetical protein
MGATAGNRTARRVVLLATPIAVGLVTAVHPIVRGAPSADLHGRVGTWLAVHVLQLAMFCLLAATVWLLVDGLPGRAAGLSRAALAPFLAFYGAFDAVVGISTGLLVRQAADLPQAGMVADALWAGRFGNPWIGAIVLPGILAWVTASVAAAVALARAGAPRSGVVALLLAGVLLGVDHAPPFGPLAMAALLVAVLRVDHGRRRAGAPGAAGSGRHPRPARSDAV